jgi:hypothetical protein
MMIPEPASPLVDNTWNNFLGSSISISVVMLAFIATSLSILLPIENRTPEQSFAITPTEDG